jgi:hypothetical protein
MKIRCLLAGGMVVLLYAVFPFFAGVVDLGRDRRGPKIYLRTHHELLYCIGYGLARSSRPRVPMHKERGWIYGN